MKAQIKVTIENVEGLTKRNVIDVLIEEELNEFDRFLTTTFRGTAPMANFERAMVKSYVMHKIASQVEKLPG